MLFRNPPPGSIIRRARHTTDSIEHAVSNALAPSRDPIIEVFYRACQEPFLGSHLSRDWPPRMEIGEEMKRKVQERWREYGFV